MEEKDQGRKQVSDELLKKICLLLEEHYLREERKYFYASVKDVLVLLGKGALLTSLFIAPGMSRALKPVSHQDQTHLWKKFNNTYLRRTIKRLSEQKIVTIDSQNDHEVVTITEKGKKKILKYALSDLSITNKKWDGKWRIVLYDIPKKQKRLQTIIREMLKRLKFYQLQKSVYLTPFPCEEEVLFLREYLGAGDHLQLLTVKEIENSQVFREFFGL